VRSIHGHVEVIAAIIEELSPYAAVRLSDQLGKIFLDALDDQPLRPPAVIIAPAEALAEYMRSSGDAAGSLYTDVGPEEGGLHLLVHLTEEVLTKAQAGTTITVEKDEITVRGGRGVDLSGLDRSGEYHWTVDGPDNF